MKKISKELLLDSKELLETSTTTRNHYESRAQGFWQGTKDHDVSQNVQALLRHLPRRDRARILDFGCGPGRDVATFRDLGFEAVGLDGTASFVEMARDHSGCEVLHQDFLTLDLTDEHFDGIFANASLFHIPNQVFPSVLQQLRKALSKEGVLFSSNPHGSNVEGWSGERYCSYLDPESYSAALGDAGFVELEHYYRPAGLPREQQPWFASVWRKLG